MEDKELKALEDQIKTEQKKQTDAVEAMRKASADQKAELEGKIAESDKKIQKLSEQQDAIQLSLKDRTLGMTVSRYDALYKFWKENKATLVKPGGFQGKQLVMDLPGNPTMYFKTTDEPVELSDAVADHWVLVPFRTPGIEKLPDRQVLMLDAVGRGIVGPTSRVSWVERSARTDNTAPVVEDATYLTGNFTWIANSAEIERIGQMIKVTREAFEDWDVMFTEIRNELFPSLERAVENQVYQGTGASPQLDGIITTAGAYASATLNTSVPQANNYDCIRAAINQLAENNYTPNYCFLPPAEAAKLDLAKSTTGVYALPPFSTPGGRVISGVKVVESNLMVAGSLLVGDFSKCTLYTRRGMEVRLWEQDSTDPEFDRLTITASVRCALKNPTQHQGNTGAFVYDQIADINAAILLV